jgi:hypothetical protein
MFAWLRSLFAPKTPAPDFSQAPAEPVPAERVPSTRPSNQQGWIGVDLDGTLAEATPWQGMSHIGPPVPLMMRRVQQWLSKGLRVKIMTARAGDPEGVVATQAWLKANGLPELEVTDKKDFGMIELWEAVSLQPGLRSGDAHGIAGAGGHDLHTETSVEPEADAAHHQWDGRSDMVHALPSGRFGQSAVQIHPDPALLVGRASRGHALRRRRLRRSLAQVRRRRLRGEEGAKPREHGEHDREG